MSSLPLNIPSPLQKIENVFPFHCFIKRDDLIHHEISGNKYRKLKYIIQEAINSKKKGIITFGGPFSNHIYATAAYAHLIQLPSVGIIRGEQDFENPTIKFAIENGMEIHFVNRNEYKNKNSKALLTILSAYQDFIIIPDGGYHPLALKGVQEIIDELGIEPEYIACSVGTGTTAAGLLTGILKKGLSTKLLAFTPLKNKSLKSQILELAQVPDCDRLIMIEEYHKGGYAKLDSELLTYNEQFSQKTNIALDPIYTLKMMHGIHDMSKANYFKIEDKIVLYHSGGLQGWKGIAYLQQK